MLQPIPKGPSTHSVSGNQERYLLAERFTEASYPIPFSYRIRGRVDPERLQSALDAVVARHDVLRATFRPQGASFVAEVRPSVDVRLAREELDGADPATVREHIVRHFDTKIENFVPAELVKAHLISTGREEHVLTLSLHHAIGDGVSMEIFAREVFAAYAGTALPATGPDYYELIGELDYSDERREADRAYWHQQLAGIDDVASLRSDLNAPNAGHAEIVSILNYEELKGLASRLDVSPFVAMLSITDLVLARFTGSDDIQLTFQSAGRRSIAGSDEAIGPFSNSVVLRTRLDPDERFEALARRQRAALTEALEHELYPYHLIVRETGVQPRFGINWFPATLTPGVEGLEISERDFLFYDSNYELNIRLVRADDTVRMLVHYDATQYSRARIEQIIAAIETAVRAVIADPSLPAGKVLPAPAPLEVPQAPPHDGARMFDAFLARAAEAPERVALIGDGQRFTYGDVEARSAALARRLVAAGLGPGSRVAVLAQRGPRLVWTMLAVLRIGATYVPLDGDYPEDRLKTLVGLARPDALLLPERGPAPAWAKAVSAVHFVDDQQAAPVPPEAVPAERLAAGDPDQPAYMLFTSGSTGTPKCIATSHRPVLNFLKWQRETFVLAEGDRFTNLCGLAHDMMIRDVFAPLSIGAQLAIPHQDDIFKPGRLLEWCLEQAPTVTHLTPAMAQLLSMAQKDGQTLPLRLAFFGGDRLLPEIVAKLRALAPGAEIVNFYGTTETPQAASFHRCDPDAAWRTHPIGRGIDNFSLRIVGEDHRPVADGAPGEIVVLTPYLSLGYVRDGVIQPHPEPGAYFTGDTGFALPSGDIMFTGRQDDQISIRGYRIELEEINGTLRAFPGVREAQVLIEDEVSPRLVAFAAGHDLDEDELYAWLNKQLPHYMVPSAIVCLDKLPLLPNGKLDRKALLAMPRPERQRRTSTAVASTPLEKKLVSAWKEFLRVDGIGADDSFAQLRGDSLAYVQVFLATESLVGELPDDWQTMSIRDIAALAETQQASSRWIKWIDSAMLVRAIAIVLVVALHLHAYGYGGGATSGLLMVSGYLLGRMQLRQIIAEQSIAPLMKLFRRVLVPTLLFTTSLAVAKLVTGKPIHPSVPFLYSDFVDYRTGPKDSAHGYSMYLWYICSFLQMILIMAGISWIAVRSWGGKLTAKSFALALFLIGLPLRFLLPGLTEPAIFSTGIPYFSTQSFWPTTHFSTLALGMCLANADTVREKLALGLLTLAYAAATFFYTPSNGYMIVAFSGLMLLYVRRLPIPRGLHMAALLLSGSSLFIYLTHLYIANAIELTGLSRDNPLMLIAVLLIGAGLWLAWQRGPGLLRRGRASLAARSTEEEAAEAA